MSAPAHKPTVPPYRIPQPEYPRNACIHQLLEAAAQEHATSEAVDFEGRSLTYAELHARANQLARLLQDRGVGPEVLVGVSMERSVEMVVALLGILKAGGAYVPLDPSFGKGRIQYVLDEAKVRVLITQEPLRDSLPPTTADIICLDSAWSALSGQSDQPISAGVSSSNLAYVIYTSGSTGKPKGVQLEHRSVVNFLCSMRREPGMDNGDVLVAVTTISFDIAGLEIFVPLLVGGRLIVASRQGHIRWQSAEAATEKFWRYGYASHPNHLAAPIRVRLAR